MSEKEDKNYLISLQDFLKEVTATKEHPENSLLMSA